MWKNRCLARVASGEAPAAIILLYEAGSPMMSSLLPASHCVPELSHGRYRLPTARRALLALLVSLLSVTALGQTKPDKSPSYLFRIEHIRPDDDVCALVRGDGQFHYERNRGDKDTILEGDLPPAVLEQLIRIVSGDELFQLRQENIPQPLIVSRDFDELLLSVLRPGQWQNLRFPTPETRQPFENSLDPLMKWLDSVAKEKHHQLDEFAGRNNCQPPGEITLKTRPSKTPNETSSPSATDSPTGPALVPHYFFKSIENQSTANQVQRTCFLLHDSTHYHFERRSQQFGKHDVQSLIIEGSLDAPDAAKLKAMLDSPDWKDASYEEAPAGMPVRSGEIGFFFIPRGNRIQKLTFWHYVGPGKSVLTGASPVSENHSELLQAYENWLQFSVDTINAKPLSVTAGNDCAVEP
jgi:hypothetical protein